jgi:DNA processing protein
MLDVAGTWPRDRPSVAIVGTRRASAEALDLTRTLARALASAGVLVVSGGAYGIDAAAHEGALEAGAPTVAILGTPLDRLYPADHAPLFRRIREVGALVSELPRGGRVTRRSFLARNRLIAATVDAVVLVQAPRRSGALGTAAFAQALRRPLYACPWSPLDEGAEGGLALLAEGRARLCRGAHDLAAGLGVQLRPAPSVAAPPVHDPLGVLGVLGRRAVHVDVLALRLGVPVAALLPALVELELAGVVVSGPAGHRRR